MDRVLFLCCLLLIVSFKSVSCIDCYQCVGTDPTNPFLCNEFLDDDHDLLPISCEEVYGAKHCIKHTGRFEGGIGTKRYCSALDLGNYCNYVKHAGDQLEYRSCVFTCSTDGCNSATLSTLSASLTLLPLSLLLLYILLR